MEDHPPGQVRPGQPGSHAGAVAGVGAVVPGQVQGGQPGREPGHGLEEVEEALVLYPVGHAQQARPATLAQVGRRAGRSGGQVAARRHHPDPPGREPLAGQLVTEGLAGHHEQAGAAVGQPVHRGLDAPPQRPVVDPARRLVQAAHQRCPAVDGAATARGRRRRCCPAPGRPPCATAAARPGQPMRAGGRGGRGRRRSGRRRRSPAPARPCGGGSGSRRSGGRGHPG